MDVNVDEYICRYVCSSTHQLYSYSLDKVEVEFKLAIASGHRCNLWSVVGWQTLWGLLGREDSSIPLSIKGQIHERQCKGRECFSKYVHTLLGYFKYLIINMWLKISIKSQLSWQYITHILIWMRFKYMRWVSWPYKTNNTLHVRCLITPHPPHVCDTWFAPDFLCGTNVDIRKFGRWSEEEEQLPVASLSPYLSGKTCCVSVRPSAEDRSVSLLSR